MGSLALVDKYIDDDFLLVEGDTFYERKVLEQLDVVSYNNCFAITEESGSGDEAFVETCEGFITKISKDRHQICNYKGELLGIAKISHRTFLLMLEKWRDSNNPYLNNEYLFFDSTNILERHFLFFPNLIWGDVDNKDDLRKLTNYIYPRLRRKENPFDLDNITQYMREIFLDKSIDSNLKVTQIGGMSNKNFKVELGDEEYVLRVPGIGAEGMVERVNEEINSLRACKMGINPQILYFNSHTGIKLTHFIKYYGGIFSICSIAIIVY